MNERNFSFRDWKNPERLNKHAMTKWIFSKNLDSGESVIDLLDSHHKDIVKADKQYMKIIIESLHGAKNAICRNLRMRQTRAQK